MQNPAALTLCLPVISAADVRAERGRERASRGIVTCLALLLAVAWAAPARAQCPAVWVPGIGTPGLSGTVFAITVLPDGDLIVAGSFSNAGGVPEADLIARYRMSTGAWSALGQGVFGNAIYALAVLPDGRLIAGGEFTGDGSAASVNLAQFDPSTNDWSPILLSAGPNSRVNAIAVLPGGDLLVGGQFSSAGGVPAHRIFRCNPTNGSVTSLGLTSNETSVNALAVLAGGGVIVGGHFNFGVAGGGTTSAVNIAHFDPTDNRWSSPLQPDPNRQVVLNGAVNALAVLPGGDLIVGGAFTNSLSFPSSSRVARYNPTTGAWLPMGEGIVETSAVVNAVAVLPEGDVLVGGTFTRAGGVLGRNRIARNNPTTGVWTGLGQGTSNTVNALAVLSSGDVIVGGAFGQAGGVMSNRIARLSPGANEPSITTQPLPVVTAASASAIFYVGVVAGVGTTPVYQWRKGGVAINVGTNPTAATPVLTLTNVQAADLGSYTCFVTNACGGTGLLSSAATLSFVVDPCPADFDGNGEIAVPDVFAFLAAWFAGCP